jgi:carbamoyl-phosphate synthase large subunit
VLEDDLYILEANPRASRSLPFVGRATGLSLAGMAARVMAGRQLEELGLLERPQPAHVSIKACSFPFHKFPGAVVHLGPEMKSTGESMGIGSRFGAAFGKALAGVGQPLPDAGAVYLSAGPSEWTALVPIAKRLSDLRFTLLGDPRTVAALQERGQRATALLRGDLRQDELLHRVGAGGVAMVISAASGVRDRELDSAIRRQCMVRGVPFLPTVEAGLAAAISIWDNSRRSEDVRCLQELHGLAAGIAVAEDDGVREDLAMRTSA